MTHSPCKATEVVLNHACDTKPALDVSRTMFVIKVMCMIAFAQWYPALPYGSPTMCSNSVHSVVRVTIQILNLKIGSSSTESETGTDEVLTWAGMEKLA